MPAFSLLRLADDTGYPLHCPNLSTLKEVGRASEWIWPSSPLWAVSTYLRSGKGKELNLWLTRARVATLSETHINTLFEILVNGGRSALSTLEQVKGTRRSYAHSALPGILETLSRLSFRLDAVQLDDLFKFTLEACRNLAVQNNLAYFESLTNLLKRVTVALSPETLFSKLPALMKLPYAEKTTPLSTNWPEPSYFIDAHKMKAVNKTEDIRSNLEKLIPMLSDRVRNGEFQARWRSIWRLLRLQELEILSAEEQTDFAKALWSRLDKNGLPEMTNALHASLLYFPEPESGKTEKALKDFLKNEDISPVFILTGNGFRTNGGLAGDIIIRTWLDTNRLPQVDEGSQIGIDWTASDVETLIRKLCQWSREEPKDISKGIKLFDSDLHDRLHLIDRCLSEIIYPRANQLSDIGNKNLAELRLHLKAIGHQEIVSLPSSLCLDKSETYVEEVKRQLKIHLGSTNPEIVRYALQAVEWWTDLADSKLVPNLPKGLLRELSNKILLRRDPELIYAIKIMANIVSKFPALILDASKDDLLQALEFLLPEVALPDLVSIDATANQRQVFTVEERPDAFAFAAELAAALQKFLYSNEAEPKILDEWRQKATSSVLPEVQRAFSTDAMKPFGK